MKKILLLGGSTQQIPAIEYANKQGYYTVLCDYLPDNPGQHYAKKFYCVSTTDRESILKVAIDEKVDGVVAYASDPAAPTAAYVAEKLGLPTNPYRSVEILSYKDKFRKYLRDNGFNCPKSQCFTSYEEAKNTINNFKFPVMVKPIDSSGSKGINRIDEVHDLKKAFDIALSNSRNKNVIIEEFIVQDHPCMIAGDCFVINGKVKYWGLLNSHRDNKVNPFVPVGTSYPILISEKRLNIVKSSIQSLFDYLEIKMGAFNIEIMFDKEDNIYFIEMGPRNGGNMIPDLLYMATGVDMVATTIETALGNAFEFNNIQVKDKYIATYVLHTEKNGLLKTINFDPEIEKNIIKKVIYKSIGEPVQYFDGSNKAIGIIFWEFDSMEEMIDKMENAEKWIKIIVE